MAKLDCCDTPQEWRCQRCDYYAHSPHMVCGVHPGGVEGDSCADFRAATGAIAAPDDPLAWYDDQWQPEGASYYGGELVLEPVQGLTLEQRLELLDTHPLSTGRCPNCEMPLRQTDPPRVHWDCGNCGWVDDSLWRGQLGKDRNLREKLR